jgi:hypothetical protein
MFKLKSLSQGCYTILEPKSASFMIFAAFQLHTYSEMFELESLVVAATCLQHFAGGMWNLSCGWYLQHVGK